MLTVKLRMRRVTMMLRVKMTVCLHDSTGHTGSHLSHCSLGVHRHVGIIPIRASESASSASALSASALSASALSASAALS